jgi:hypothetical protein
VDPKSDNLQQLTEAVSKLASLHQTEKLTEQDIQTLKEVIRAWPEIQAGLKEREQWKGFISVGRVLFWLGIGVLSIFTYAQTFGIGILPK